MLALYYREAELSSSLRKDSVMRALRAARPHMPEIVKGPYGKPVFPPESPYFGIHFNISNSGPYEIIALSDVPVGIDLQIKSLSGDHIRQISGRFYSPREVQMLSECATEEMMREVFFALWTAKEAYIKLTGEGLHKGLTTFTADLIRGEIRDPADASSAADPAAHFSAVPFPDPNFACTLCAATPLPDLSTVPLRCWKIDDDIFSAFLSSLLTAT